MDFDARSVRVPDVDRRPAGSAVGTVADSSSVLKHPLIPWVSGTWCGTCVFGQLFVESPNLFGRREFFHARVLARREWIYLPVYIAGVVYR